MWQWEMHVVSNDHSRLTVVKVRDNYQYDLQGDHVYVWTKLVFSRKFPWVENYWACILGKLPLNVYAKFQQKPSV